MLERGRSRLRAWRPPTQGLGDGVARTAGHWRDQALSTPGRLALIGLVLVLLVLAAGVATGLVTNDRENRIDTLRQSADPLSNAAQDLYASLSIANASASTAFLSGGLQPQVTVERYNSALTTASSALSTAAIGVDPGDSTAQGLLTSMSNRMPVYAGLIATANANNRAGNPVGVNYLGEASNLMQSEVLPKAEKLYSEQSSVVSSLEQRNSSIDWLPLLVTAIALVALILFQVYLARHSHRVLNFGLVLATVAMAVVLVWILVAGIVSAGLSDRAYTESTSELSRVTTARIAAQQARADETRDLLERGDDTELAGAFTRRMDGIGAALDAGRADDDVPHDDSELTDARSSLEAWQAAHQQMREHLAAGDFTGAVAVAIGTGENSSASRFADLDDALDQQIARLRAHGQNLVDRSADAISFHVVGTGLLAGLAGLGIIFGLWPRLSEYQ